MIQIIPAGDNGRNEDAHTCDFPFVIKKHTPVVAKNGTHVDKEHRPGNGTQNSEQDELPHGELGDTGRKGNKSTNAGEEPSCENGNGSIIFKPVFGGNHFLCPQASFGRMLQDEISPAMISHVVGTDRTGYAGNGPDDDSWPERKYILGHKKSCEAQDDFTGNGDIHIFQHHADKEGKVPPVRKECNN